MDRAARGSFCRLALANGLLVLAALALHADAHSQAMYKCGKVYQDRPCETGEGSKIGNATSPSARTAGAGNAVCSQRGEQATKIVWKREAGMTLEQAQNEAGSQQARDLVGAVYRVRGSATEVRARIESECTEEMERRAKAAAVLEAAGINPGAGNSPGGAYGSPSAGVPAESSAGVKPNPPAPPKKSSACPGLAGSLEDVKSRQRKGGNIATMESLNEEAREIEARMRREGC